MITHPLGEYYRVEPQEIIFVVILSVIKKDNDELSLITDYDIGQPVEFTIDSDTSKLESVKLLDSQE